MARRLGGDYTLTIQDHLSGSKIHLNYRMPTTKEIISYRNGSTRREGNQLVSRTGENRMEHGKLILTGFGDGAFEKQVGGKWAPISSDPKSPHYDPEWKEFVCENAPDLIETLAVHVFDAGNQVLPAEDIEGN